jgi:hypothetical protein
VLMTAAVEAPGAEGAAFGEILIAAGLVGAVVLVFGWITLRERTGHTTLVGRLADAIAARDGLPRWAGLPIYMATVSLLTAGIGVWWDVPIHMQDGRDEGPLANPSHYLILFGILGFLHAGILSMALATDPLPRRTVRISGSWRAPMGSLILFGAGAIALLGFPADDVWHRMFGQDVTEWGPTHVMMIGGAVTAVLAFPLLLAESLQVRAAGAGSRYGRFLMGFSLAACSIPFGFLMEFDLGLPQFPLSTQYIIFGFLVGWIAVAVRMWVGPGGALAAAATYLGLHAAIALPIILLLDDVLIARFLLFVPAAVLVEVAALVVSPKRRPLAFALLAGLLVGTLGLLAEWGWAHWFMPLPQPTDAQHLPFLLAVGTAAAIGGALLATWHVARLREVADEPVTRDLPAAFGSRPGLRRHVAGLAGLAVFVGLMAVFAPPSPPEGDIRATVDYSDFTAGGGPECLGGDEKCEAHVTLRLSPADALEDAVWAYAWGWQGRGPGGVRDDATRDPRDDVPGVTRVELVPTGEPGAYRTAHPLPFYGSFKTMVRVHFAPTQMGVFTLWLPEDPAITSPRGREVLVQDGGTVELEYEKPILQRETKDGVPPWLYGTGNVVVLLMWLAMLLAFGRWYAAAASGGRAAAGARQDSNA